MQTFEIDQMRKDIIPSCDRKSPFLVRFALLCILLLLTVIRFDPVLLPLNRLTTLLSGQLLTLLGYAPTIKGNLITLSGFSVQIILECTSLHAIMIFVAFVLAQPAAPRRTLYGLLAGCAGLFSVNIVRIAAVTIVGARWPLFFDICHVYLGQVAMFLFLIAACLIWRGSCRNESVRLSFLLHATVWANILFLPWVILNKNHYLKFIDAVAFHLFTFIFQFSGFTMIQPYALYNFTFSLPLYLSLVLAAKDCSLAKRSLQALAGCLIIAIIHILLRETHLIMDCFKITELLPLIEIIYLSAQFVVPVLLWFIWNTPIRSPAVHSLVPGPGMGGSMIICLLISVTLTCPATSWAEVQVTLERTGNTSYQFGLKGMEGLTRATITLYYELLNVHFAPGLTPIDDGANGELVISSSCPTSMTITFVPNNPLYGNALLGSVTLTEEGDKGRGEVSRVTALAQTENSEGQSHSATAENVQASPESPKEEIKMAIPEITADIDAGNDSESTKGIRFSTVSDGSQTDNLRTTIIPVTTAAQQNPGDITEQRNLKSLLEQFLEYEGKRTPELLADLAARNGGGVFQQKPALVVTDGKTSLKMVFSSPAASEKNIYLIIKNARFNEFSWLQSGELAVSLLPDKGALNGSVTLVSGGNAVKYPLSIAPPLSLFNANTAQDGEADFVSAANNMEMM